MKLSNYELIIKEVLKQYNLGTLNKFQEVSGGFINFNNKIITTRGTYFLREFKNNFNIDEIKEVNNFLSNLTEDDFKHAKPIFTKSNESVIQIGKQVFSIYEFKEGNNYDRNENKMLSAAKTLAKLHVKVENIPNKNCCIKLCKDTSKIERLWNDIQYREQKTNFEKEFLKLVGEVLKHFKLLQKDLPYVRKRNNLSVIHGDFWYNQLIFQKHEVAALIDFDKIILGYPEHDLMKGIRTFIWFKKSKINSNKYNLNKLERFIKSYITIYGKLDLEPREVIAFLRHAVLEATVVWMIDVAFKQQTEFSLKIATKHLNELDWIKENENKIISLFMKYSKNK